MSEGSHKCGWSCLGPLTFHCQAVGDMVSLSQGGRLAKRMEGTFKNGLVFSSREVRVQERVCLRVEKDLFNWHGALRVGFTTVSPTSRALPLPCMAIPNLTDTGKHWAAPVHESLCRAGSKLEFWVSHGGAVYVKSNTSKKHMLLRGVDLSRPLWAIIDIYGQTCSILLLRSKKTTSSWTRQSCPVPECITSTNSDNFTCISGPNVEIPQDKCCVVCLGKKASVTLPCGHQCLCHYCANRVIYELGNCPLCRYNITAPSEEDSCIPYRL
ncbi:E3 ubiquitin-protein ligase NEURL3 [Scomber japonicus]|uniref:E3 ubiquitin-protein ligase NEURL3 n=1 Tax=Scomber japonicus TaxID=13676 RepID=UPI002306C4C9|nr:E3 ubiquitin-protein ligase NEURL3 [Scomber japonicus]